MKEHEIIKEMNQLRIEMADFKKSNESKGIKGCLSRAMSRTSVIAGVLIAGLMASVVLYANQIEFSNGQIINADDVNTNFTEINNKIAELAANSIVAPVGSIVAWHKDMSSSETLTLPAGWVECDGSNVVDGESPFFGKTLPNLNKGARFLRGGANSGVFQDDAMQRMIGLIEFGGTSEAIGANRTGVFSTSISHRNANGYDNNSTDESFVDIIFDNSAEGTYKTDGTGTGDGETRPSNMSVIWILRIK